MGWFLLRKPYPGLTVEERVVIENNEILVGRGRDCFLHCLSVFVSRHHLKIFLKDDGSLFVKDLGSSNGTFLNGEKIAPDVEFPLHLEDELGLGNSANINKDCFLYIVCSDIHDAMTQRVQPNAEERNHLSVVESSDSNLASRAPKRFSEPEVVTLLDDEEELSVASKKSRIDNDDANSISTVPPCPAPVPLFTKIQEKKVDTVTPKPKNQRLSALIAENSAFKAECSDSSATTVKLEEMGLSTSSTTSTPLKNPFCPANGKPLLTSTPCFNMTANEVYSKPPPALSNNNCSPTSRDSSRNSLGSAANYTLDEEIIAISDDDEDAFPCSQMFSEDVKPDVIKLNSDLVVDLSHEEDSQPEELDDVILIGSEEEDGEDMKDLNRWIERLSQSMGNTEKEAEKEEGKETGEKNKYILEGSNDLWDQEFEELQVILNAKEHKEAVKYEESGNEKPEEVEEVGKNKVENVEEIRLKENKVGKKCKGEKVKPHKERKKLTEKEKLSPRFVMAHPVCKAETKRVESAWGGKTKQNKEDPKRNKIEDGSKTCDTSKVHKPHRSHSKSSNDKEKKLLTKSSRDQAMTNLHRLRNIFKDGSSSSSSDSEDKCELQMYKSDDNQVKPMCVSLERVEDNPKICEQYGIFSSSSTASHLPLEERKKIKMIDALPHPPRKASNRGISESSAVKLFDSSREERRSSNDYSERKRKDSKSIRKEKLAEVAARHSSKSTESSSLKRVAPAKIKVTSSNRGSFLTADDEPKESSKPPRRNDVLKMKIPKLKKSVLEAPHHSHKSPLQGMNMSWDKVPPSNPAERRESTERHEKSERRERSESTERRRDRSESTERRGKSEIGDKEIEVSTKEKSSKPAAPVEIPTGPQPKKRVAKVPPPGFHDDGIVSNFVQGAVMKSCLASSNKHNISLNTRASAPTKKRVKFKENLVEIRLIDKLPGTRPLGLSKDAQVPVPLSLCKAPGGRPVVSNAVILEEVICHIIKWNPIWLKEEKNLPADILPPVVPNMNLPEVPRTEFLDFQEYHETWYPLLMLNLWAALSKDYNKISNDIRFFMAVDSFNSARVVSRPDKTIMTLHCHMLMGRRDQGFYPRLGNLVMVDLALKDPTGKPLVMPVFAYCSFFSREPLRRGVEVHKDLMAHCTDEPIFKLRFSLLVTEKKIFTLANERLMLIKNVTYLRGDLRVFLAMRNLEHIGLLYSVLSPTAANEDFTLPDVRTKKLFIPPLRSKETPNPLQAQVVLQTAEVCLEDKPKICLIQGPPGTGKSETITNLVLQLLYRDNVYTRANREKGLVPRILLCAPSNTAIDVLVRRLLRRRELLEKHHRFKMVRVGQAPNMHPEVKEISLEELAQRDMKAKDQDSAPETIDNQRRLWEAKLKGVENNIQDLSANNKPIPESLTFRQADLIRGLKVLEERRKHHSRTPHRPPNQTVAIHRETTRKILRGADIVATTLTSCLINVMENVFPPFSEPNRYHFQVCIVDEATQCLELETLIPLMLGVKTLVLVGDSNQLPATILSKVAREKGLGTSLFARLQKVVPNAVQMLNVQYRMHPAILEWPNHFFYSGRLKTPDEIVSRRNSNVLPYAILSLPYQQDPTREVNLDEAKLVLVLAELMIEKKAIPFSSYDFRLGIITPYASQKQTLIDLLSRNYKNIGSRVEVNTIDAYQGQEKDIIIISCVRTNGIGFLSDRQRLNVALTRAKYSLIICGNFSSLDRDPMWNNLLSDARQRKCFLSVNANFNFQNKEHLWNVISKKQLK